MVTFDNYRDKTWRAFRDNSECLGIITKVGPARFQLDTFKRKYEFKKLRRAQRFLRERVA